MASSAGSSSGNMSAPGSSCGINSGNQGGGRSCLVAPCNSALRSSAFGSPDQAFFNPAGVMQRPSLPTEGGEGQNTKRLVNLRRQDFFVLGNGGVALELARSYNNLMWTWADNDDGLTMLGPKWTFGYEMSIGASSDTEGDCFVRRNDGGLTILYHKTNPDRWESNPAQGEALILTLDSSQYKLATMDPAVWYTFDLTGKVTTMRYRNGNRLLFSRDGQGRLSRVDLDHETQDIDDRALTFEYTSITYNGRTRDRLWKVRFQPSNEVVATYSYDSNGMLYEVRNRLNELIERYTNSPAAGDGTILISAIQAPDGNGGMRQSRAYEYGVLHCLTMVRDGAGTPIQANAFVDNWYNGMTYFASGLSYWYDISYGKDAKRTKIWMPNPTRCVSDKQQDLIADSIWMQESRIPKRSYDTDTGSTTTYEYYDESSTGSMANRSRLKKVTEPDGSYVEYEYDASNRVTAVKRPLGRDSYTGYDSEGNVVWTRDALGNTWYNTYDTWGRLVRSEDPTSGVVQHAYSTHGLATVTTNTEGRAALQQYDSRDCLTHRDCTRCNGGVRV